MSPRKNTKKAAAKSDGGGKLKSAFDGGKQVAISHGRSKDRRNQWFVEGLKGGVVVGYFKKATKDEEAFAAPFFQLLETSVEDREELGCSAILLMKGVDGETPKPQNPGTTWGWRLLLFIVGENGNTPEKRREISNLVISKFNDMATSEHYRYPTKLRFGDDQTAPEHRAIDTMVLDEDVIGMMNAAYGQLSTYEDMMVDPEIMADFWEDPTRGSVVMEQFLSTHTNATQDQPTLFQQESDSSEDWE